MPPPKRGMRCGVHDALSKTLDSFTSFGSKTKELVAAHATLREKPRPSTHDLHKQQNLYDAYHREIQERLASPGAQQQLVQQHAALLELPEVSAPPQVSRATLPFHMVFCTSLVERMAGAQPPRIWHCEARCAHDVMLAGLTAERKGVCIILDVVTMNADDFSRMALVYNLSAQRGTCIMYHLDNFVTCTTSAFEDRLSTRGRMQSYFEGGGDVNRCGILERDNPSAGGNIKLDDRKQGNQQRVNHQLEDVKSAPPHISFTPPPHPHATINQEQDQREKAGAAAERAREAFLAELDAEKQRDEARSKKKSTRKKKKKKPPDAKPACPPADAKPACPPADAKPACPPPGAKPLTEMTECVICLDALKSHVLTPCGHVCVCEACAKSIQIGDPCPVCRKEVEAKFRVYF